MSYRLLIRNRSVVNSDGTTTRHPWRELDLGDERPAMTYQINDLNELKDRNATYSQKIKLPKSDSNNRALGFVENFEVVSEAAYTPMETKLECEGVPISPYGALLYVDAVNQYIECQIVSSIIDLFKRMETSGMAFDDYDSYTYSLQTYNNEQANPPTPNQAVPHKWALIRPYQGVIAGGIRSVFMFGNIIPCVQFLGLAKFIFRRHGFKMLTDLINDTEASFDYITCGNPKPQALVGGPSATWYGNVSIPRYTNMDSPFKPPTLSDTLDLTWGSSNNMIFIAPNPGKYRVSIRMSSTTPFNGSQYQMSWAARRRLTNPITGTMIALDSSNGAVVSAYNSSTGRYEYEYLLDATQLGVGDGLEIIFTSRGENRTAIWVDSDVSVYSEDDGFQIGSYSNLIPATDFKSNLEIVKTYLQTYGLLIDLKRYTSPIYDDMYRMPWIEGEVRCYSFAELYRRICLGKFIDWSDKLIIDPGNEHQFSIGSYGQKNYINFTENTADHITGRVVLTANNKSLDPEKELFTLPIEAGKDVLCGQRAVASAPILSAETEQIGEEQTIEHWIWAGSNPHLVRITEETIVVGIVQGNNWGTDEVTATPNADNISRVATTRLPSYIEQRYVQLQGMLTNAKRIKSKFNLSVLDIEQLDFFTPVWINFYGAYFYISKITNFVAGEPTTVELIKL